jgi:hypothetical protein
MTRVLVQSFAMVVPDGLKKRMRRRRRRRSKKEDKEQ